MRRIRMHGFALTALLNKSGRRFVATRSKKKAVEIIDPSKKTKNWNKYENLSFFECL
jgi:hypothetical protein